jgi:hypothetical protein
LSKTVVTQQTLKVDKKIIADFETQISSLLFDESFLYFSINFYLIGLATVLQGQPKWRHDKA